MTRSPKTSASDRSSILTQLRFRAVLARTAARAFSNAPPAAPRIVLWPEHDELVVEQRVRRAAGPRWSPCPCRPAGPAAAAAGRGSVWRMIAGSGADGRPSPLRLAAVASGTPRRPRSTLACAAQLARSPPPGARCAPLPGCLRADQEIGKCDRLAVQRARAASAARSRSSLPRRRCRARRCRGCPCDATPG